MFGGFDKVIKFIFGSIDELCVVSEMEVLNWICDLRYFFIFFIECIEIVGGILLIVLELVEGNFCEVF